MNNRRIEDFDFYLGLAILCYALNAPKCGGFALGIVAWILLQAAKGSTEK